MSEPVDKPAPADAQGEKPGEPFNRGVFNGLYTEYDQTPYEQEYYDRLDASDFGQTLLPETISSVAMPRIPTTLTMAGDAIGHLRNMVGNKPSSQPEVSQTPEETETLTPAEFASDFAILMSVHGVSPAISWAIASAEEEALKKTVTPAEEQAVTEYAELLNWRLTAFPEASDLPGWLTLVDLGLPNSHPPIVQPAPDSALASFGAMKYIYNTWDYEPLEKLLPDPGFPSEAKDILRKNCAALIRGSDTYKFLQSFLAEAQTEDQERPLTQNERLFRIADIQEGVYRRHFLLLDTVTASEGDLQKEAGRQSSMVDEERRRGKQPDKEQEDVARQKFKAFIAPYLLKPEGRPGYIDINDALNKATEIIDDLELDMISDTGSVLRRSGAITLLGDMISDDFYTNTVGATFAEKLQTVLPKAAGNITNTLGEYLGNRYRHFFDINMIPAFNYFFEPLDYELKRPNAPIITAAEYKQAVDKTSPVVPGAFTNFEGTFANYVDKFTYQSGESIILAEATGRLGADQYMGQRLIYTTIRNPEIPTEAPDIDLVISFFDNQIIAQGTDPFITGYQLAYRDEKGNFGFKKDHLSDPYLMDVDLPPAYEQLVDFYREHGLTELVEHLQNYPPSTLREFTAVVAAASHYYLPEHPQYLYNIGFDSFIDTIALDGKLYVQCQAAARFLNESLKLMYGEELDALGFMEGYSFTTNGFPNVTALQHRQSLAVINGQQLILDATPGLEYRSGAEVDTSWSGFSGLLQLFKRKPKQQRPDNLFVGELEQLGVEDFDNATPPNAAQDVINAAEQIAEAEQERQERLARQTNALLHNLGNIFEERDREKLLGKINRLKSTDPVGQVVGLALKRQNDRLKDSGIEQVQTYLENYRKASKVVRKRIGLPDYDRHTLDVLEAYFTNII